MSIFDYYLEKNGEVGYADQVVGNLVYASGLPTLSPGEVVIFENDELGMALSLSPKLAEILTLSSQVALPGEKIARSGDQYKIPVGEYLLGTRITPLSVNPLVQTTKTLRGAEWRLVDVAPKGLAEREAVKEPFETGVAVVDLITPLGRGQRELVLGDRKTGKTKFLFQIAMNNIKSGAICVYAAIGKRRADVIELTEVLLNKGFSRSSVVVYSTASDPPGLSFLTPYVAMTIAEYFRDRGGNVLVFFDDLTTHAKYWRQISLLARRFPGRNSYPGDIFYLHSKLLERAGNFKKGSITAFPVAETVLGDISGYIQTNLMSMTDGHLFFDSDLFDQGRRPSINPLLSVTRVGLQAHSPLLKDLARTLTSFLVYIERMRRYMHFGSELGEEARANLALGERVMVFLQQAETEIIPIDVNIVLAASLWAGVWRRVELERMKAQMLTISVRYATDGKFKSLIDSYTKVHTSFKELVTTIKRQGGIISKQ